MTAEQSLEKIIHEQEFPFNSQVAEHDLRLGLNSTRFFKKI
jgi:hypothetical protein